MLSTNIFYSGYNILFGILSLFLGMGSVFLVRDSKTFRSLLFFQLGGIFMVLITYLAANEHVLYKVGLNYNFVAFVKMLLALITSILWINSASELYNNKPANREVLTFYISLCLAGCLYYSFFSYDVQISSLLGSLITLAGLTFLLFSSFLYVLNNFHSGTVLLCLSIVMLWGKLLVSTYFFKYNWLNLNIFNWFWIYVFTAAVVFIKLSEMHGELKKSWNMVDKLNLQINNMVDFSPFPILITKITGDKILLMNNKACDLFGISKKESGYFKLKDFFVDDDNRNQLLALLEKEHEVQDFDLMVCNIINATPFWLSVSAKAIEYNNEMALYLAFQNITLRKERENKLRNQADRDPLTLLWNRRYFEKLVPERIKESIKKSQYFSLLMLDADHFKNINDTYGHKVGDRVLIELAACCQNSLREEDVVCRYGGEEFVVFLDNTNTQSAQIVAERLRQAIAQIEAEGDNGEIIKFTVSIGVVSSEKNDSMEILLRQVDDAMYLAKHSGRNCVKVYDEQELLKIIGRGKKENSPSRHIHPVFQNEEAEEISLLDSYENKML